MKLVRTTLRLQEPLKKNAEQLALEQNTSLQDIFNKALAAYLRKVDERNADYIIFKTHDLGVPLDNLTRDDIYNE
jgi:hypothetical protein